MELKARTSTAAGLSHHILARFHAEVLRPGPTGMLPRSLSNEWLDILVADAGLYLKNEAGRPFCFLAMALSMLVSAGKGGECDGVQRLREGAPEYVRQLLAEHARRRQSRSATAPLA